MEGATGVESGRGLHAVQNLAECRRALETVSVQKLADWLGAGREGWVLRLSIYESMHVGTGMISFVVPAHNEEACLVRTLEAIHDSARATGLPYEIIVADDASTDGTAEIARQKGAVVVTVNHRQIAATRNSGGRAAQGDWLFFVDADTTANPRAVAAALRCMKEGAAGGGAPTWADKHEKIPLYVRVLGLAATIVPKLAGFTGGAFMFCTREAFHATGGFNERLYWAEEGGFALALKREGRFVVLWQRVATSGRRFRKITGLELVAGAARIAFSPFKSFTRRSSVEKVWYDSNRADDDEMPNSAAARLSNAIAFLLVIDVMAALLCNFVPWSVTPRESAFGHWRLFNAIVLAHVGLVLWPVTFVLVANFFRQKRWTGVIQSACLIGFCGWQAVSATRGTLWFWGHAYHWLMAVAPW